MKVLVLGIDALDRVLLEKLQARLPNLTKLRNSSKELFVQSTFPPDSDTAWATISTGLNPAQHGIVRFVDPLEKSYQILNQGSRNSILHGKTFWELVGKKGYKSFAIFPHLCYPIWNTSGVMVARGSTIADVQANPPEILKQYPDLEILTGIRGFPKRTSNGMQGYFEQLSELAKADAEFALKLLKNEEWDLFFVYWSTIDAIGHFFWNYYDKSDPNYKAGHPLEDIIPKTYELYDKIVGDFLEAIENDTTVIILSDHGHGARPFRLVSVNEILRQGGYLNARDLKSNPHLNLFEKVKRVAVRIISRFGLGRVAGQIMRNFPVIVQSFTRPSSINWEITIAYATDMSGIKPYTYGGIIINKSTLNESNLDYEEVRTKIIDLIKLECKLPDGESLIQFIARREEVYSGPFIEKYPDILLEFKYGYGVGWAIDVPLLTDAATYNLVPGSHRGETGTCFIRSPKPIKTDTVDLLDITPTILDLFNIPQELDFSGKNIFEKG
jgi:predicted AlkP superfamily phosphohydrolase/phosphomutase